MSEETQEVAESAETTTDDNQESNEESNSTGEGESEATTEGSEQRATESPEAKRSRLERQLSQHNKKHPLESQKGNQEGGQESNEEEKVDDRYERLELKTEGIKGTKEQDVVLEYIKESKLVGKDVSVEDALKSLVVREALAGIKAKSSIPAPSKRTGGVESDSFDYWKKQALKGNFPRDDKVMMKRLEKARIFTS